ncbi:hypothetical protein [Paraburkholderia megapolitana]|uniref:hypothetical protein n=1 Tax=Paraburkholderia megapolitana TaxID=420953 RepID=UPI000B8769B3|nr:hypothetical protein [Paraburkholderia megapolitana]QDQ82928.1 hypothetical protein FNZ07_16970 [Paraburkholderia megapolitana]
MRETDTIALIVDPDFGALVDDIAAKVAHTWIVDSDENCAAVKEIWQSSTRPLDQTMKNGITTFRRYGADRESWCDAVLDSIEDHHDSRRGNPGYALLEVYGTPLTDRLRSSLIECGFSTFTATDFGFRAEKVE